MNRERWLVVSPHLDRALALEPQERREWLDALRLEESDLADDVEALLAEHDAANREGFLEGSAAPLPPSSLAGLRLGAYTLKSPIGQGGMGTVWLAERSDGRFTGRAAVKLLNAALIGRAGEERFRREGNVLARLEHPHISRLLDAGVSPTGQPYLVLEHVEGEQIDRYCDSRALDLEARIVVFLDVLAAVAHAHANLVVHRDIKPSNVMVSAAGEVKLLDFGIAKLLEGDAALGNATALTRDGGSALTPEFAAPEQLRGEPITTATDVYALGVLLYVLLTGTHPAEAARETPSELMRAIVDSEPERPSVRVSDTRTHPSATLAECAARRSSTPDRLRRALRGDLDTIVAKALKKRPAERYASVNAFAQDLQRSLQHQPIAARPDSVTYRASRFVRRHRLPVALAAMIVAALGAGLAGTALQARRAQRQSEIASEQRDFALKQLSRAEALNELNAFLLSDAAPGGRPFTVGELLTQAEQIVERPSAESAESRAEMLIAIGRQLSLQDESVRSRRLLDESYQLTRTSEDPAIRAKAACALASTVARSGEFELGERLYAEGMADIAPGPQNELLRIFCLRRGSEAARDADRPKLALERIEEANATLRRSGQGSPLLQLRVALDLAESYRVAGRRHDALAAFERSSELLSALGRQDTETAGTLFNNWALVLFGMGRPLEAERLYRRAVDIASDDGTLEDVSPMLLSNLGRTLDELGHPDAARDMVLRAQAKASRKGDRVVVTQTQFHLVNIERELGDLTRAEQILEQLESWAGSTLPPDHVQRLVLLSQRGLLALERGDRTTARDAQDAAVARAREQGETLLLTVFLIRRAEVERREAQGEAVVQDALEALELARQGAGAGQASCWVGRAELALARGLRLLGRDDEARAAATRALEQLEPTLGSEHPETREARQSALGEPA